MFFLAAIYLNEALLDVSTDATIFLPSRFQQKCATRKWGCAADGVIYSARQLFFLFTTTIKNILFFYLPTQVFIATYLLSVGVEEDWDDHEERQGPSCQRNGLK